MSSGYVSIKILQPGRLRQIRDPQALTEVRIVAFGEFMLQQHGQTFLEAQGTGVRIAELVLEDFLGCGADPLGQ
jgi:hypothetical protein